MTEWVTAPEPPTEKKAEDRNRERGGGGRESEKEGWKGKNRDK